MGPISVSTLILKKHRMSSPRELRCLSRMPASMDSLLISRDSWMIPLCLLAIPDSKSEVKWAK
jgi:hypothetical protein